MEMNENERKAIIEGYLAAYNAFDIDTMVSFIHPDVIFKNIVGDEINATATGIDELRAMAEQSKSLFSSRCQKIESFNSVGNTATAEIKFEAMLAGDLPNGMKAGDTLKLDGRSEFEFKDGKLLKITDYS